MHFSSMPVSTTAIAQPVESFPTLEILGELFSNNKSETVHIDF